MPLIYQPPLIYRPNFGINSDLALDSLFNLSFYKKGTINISLDKKGAIHSLQFVIYHLKNLPKYIRLTLRAIEMNKRKIVCHFDETSATIEFHWTEK